MKLLKLDQTLQLITRQRKIKFPNPFLSKSKKLTFRTFLPVILISEAESENPVKANDSENLENDEETVQTIPQVKYEELSKDESDKTDFRISGFD